MTQKRLKSSDRRRFSTRKKLRSVNINQNPNREIRPRLSVHRTNTHIYAQITSPSGDKVLAAASSAEKEVRAQLKHGGNKKAAEVVGARIAEKAKQAGIEAVAFDRGGNRYHGRVKALAEAARAGGRKF